MRQFDFKQTWIAYGRSNNNKAATLAALFIKSKRENPAP
jgi:hypothetical protein